MEMIPYDKRSGKIWFNGQAVNWEDAQIHVLNQASLCKLCFRR